MRLRNRLIAPFVPPEQHSLPGTLPPELIELIVRSGEMEAVAGTQPGWEAGAEMNKWSIRLAGVSSSWRGEAQKRGKYFIGDDAGLEGLLALMEGSGTMGAGARSLSVDGGHVDDLRALVALLAKVPKLESLSLDRVSLGPGVSWSDMFGPMSAMSRLQLFSIQHCQAIPANGLLVLFKSWPRLQKLVLRTHVDHDSLLIANFFPILTRTTPAPSLVDLDVWVTRELIPSLGYLASSAAKSIRRLAAVVNFEGDDRAMLNDLAPVLRYFASSATSTKWDFDTDDDITAASEIVDDIFSPLVECTTLEWNAHSYLDLPFAALLALPKLCHLLLSDPTEEIVESAVKVIEGRGAGGLACVHAFSTYCRHIDALSLIEAECRKAGVVFSEDPVCSHR